MSFAVAQPVPRHPLESAEKAVEVIAGDDLWPDVDPKLARIVTRLNGTVTDDRLVESLMNSIQAVQRELSEWRSQHGELSDKQKGLYRRAVYFTTKAELMERYRDFDSTEAGNRVADALEPSIRDAWKTVRWAVSDLMERPRVTIEVL